VDFGGYGRDACDVEYDEIGAGEDLYACGGSAETEYG